MNQKPGKGAYTVEPIRKRKEVRAIKEALAGSPRDLALFIVGVHAGLRGSDLLALRWRDALSEEGQIRRVIEVRERKTGNLRRIPVSAKMRRALLDWLDAQTVAKKIDPEDIDDELLFPNGNGHPMTIQRLHQLVNEWAKKAGVEGHFGSHSLRKTFGYHLRKRGTDLPILMKIFGHQNQSVTLRYLGIDNDEIDQAALQLNL